ncbi:SDR family oxidoreductase [Pelomyxa schiedti]|nr:SDR family oxidoreductase [Pelomyxa schiedti]
MGGVVTKTLCVAMVAVFACVGAGLPIAALVSAAAAGGSLEPGAEAAVRAASLVQIGCAGVYVVGMALGARASGPVGFVASAVWWTAMCCWQLVVGGLSLWVLTAWPWDSFTGVIQAMCIANLIVPLWVVAYLVATLYGAIALAFFYPWEDLRSLFCKRRTYGNKHVFITGGGTGLGKELGKLFARQHARVTIVSRSESHLSTVQKEIEGEGGQCQFFVCDVTRPEQVTHAVTQAQTSFGSVDVVVCSAGLAHPEYFSRISRNQASAELDLNFLGTFNAVSACVPSMLAQHSGQILLVSSGLGLMGATGYAHYSASKFALRGLAETLYMELSPHGISTHIFYPSNMDTPGYEMEMHTKPPESRVIDESAALATPAEAAAECFRSFSMSEFGFTNCLDLEFVQMSSIGITCPCRAPVRYWLIAPVWYIGVAIQRAIWMQALKKFTRSVTESTSVLTSHAADKEKIPLSHKKGN